MNWARSCWAVAAALSISACGLRDQLDPGAVSVRGVPPTIEQLNVATNRQLQDGLVEHFAHQAGYTTQYVPNNPGATLGAVDPRWGLVFEAGIYEVGRQCDQYLDALFRFNREQRANRQGLIALAAGAGAIMGLAGVTTTAIAITAAAFGLSASLFDAGVNSVLFTIEPSALRNVALRGREAYLDDLREKNVQINTRPRMMIAVQGYLSQCSPAAIEANINNAASGAPSVASTDPRVRQQAAGLAAPALSTMAKASEIVSGTVAPAAPVPVAFIPPDAVKNETPVIPELKEAQKALGVEPDGRYGKETRPAIREFQTGMYRRNPTEWPQTEITGNLTSRSGRVLPTLKPMPAVFMSPFERAYLGNDGSFFTADPLATVDPGRLNATLIFLEATPEQLGAATTLEAKMKLLRERIVEMRTKLSLPSAKPILDAALYAAVWKTSPLNVNKTP
jgi:hypothetical protein